MIARNDLEILPGDADKVRLATPSPFSHLCLQAGLFRRLLIVSYVTKYPVKAAQQMKKTQWNTRDAIEKAGESTVRWSSRSCPMVLLWWWVLHKVPGDERFWKSEGTWRESLAGGWKILKKWGNVERKPCITFSLSLSTSGCITMLMKE